MRETRPRAMIKFMKTKKKTFLTAIKRKLTSRKKKAVMPDPVKTPPVVQPLPAAVIVPTPVPKPINTGTNGTSQRAC